MSLLIDIDALCKLAHWRLLGVLPELSGITWTDCATLTSAAFRARKASVQPDGRLFRCTRAADEVIEATALMSTQVAPDIEQLSVLQDLPGIDAGEALLFASAATSSEHRLLTGDKRAIRAIAALADPLRLPYQNKIIVIEQVLNGVLDHMGIAQLREHVCPWANIDVAVRNAMGSRCDAAEQSVREGLDSYIAEMIDLCSPTLIADFHSAFRPRGLHS